MMSKMNQYVLSNSIARLVWELTLLSCGNKNNKHKNKNPHLNFSPRSCPEAMKCAK